MFWGDDESVKSEYKNKQPEESPDKVKYKPDNKGEKVSKKEGEKEDEKVSKKVGDKEGDKEGQKEGENEETINNTKDQPKNVPSGKGTINPPSGKGTINPPSGKGTINPPRDKGTVNPPSGKGTVNPPSGEQPNKPTNGEQPKIVSDEKQNDIRKNDATIYSDENKEGDTEYNFIPTKQEEPEEIFFGIIRIIPFAPVVVSFLSLSHIIRKIPKHYLMIGCLLTSVHFILSFMIISEITKSDESKKSSYTSITSSCFPLSIIVDIYLLLLKFLTCIFLIDMFLESIYSIYPNFRLDEYSFGLSKIFFLFLITAFLVFLVFIYKSIPVVLYGLNIAIIIAGVLFLICLALFSSTGATNINSTTTSSEFNLSTNLFLSFSFISFACESHSMSVMVFRRGKSATLMITVVSTIFVLSFLCLLIYFGDWLLQMSLSEALKTILSSYSDLNQTLRDTKKDSFNILSRTTFISCLLISLIGFILQITILNKSLVNIFFFLKKASNIIEFIVVFLVVSILVWLVLIRDIGRLLWWFTKILFFGFPFYIMYPYVAQIINRKSNSVYFIFSIIGILCLCYFVWLSFMYVSILNPSMM